VTAKGYFIYKVQNSTTVTGSVLLQNKSSESMTIQLASVDAMTAQKGGSAFATSAVTPTGAATWLTFAEAQVTLPAGRQKPVEFTVSMPQDLRPGQYLAGIAAYIPSVDTASAGEQGADAMGIGVKMQTRYVIGVEVDVEGVWTPSITIDSAALIVQPSGPFIGVHIKNDGDEFVKPAGTIVITDTAGKRVLEQPINMGTFVPGTDVTYPIHWSGELAAGKYHVHVSLDYAENKNAQYDSPLEIGQVAAVQNTTGEALQPGTIGGGEVVPVSPEAPAAAQAGNGVMLWIMIGIGILLLAIVALFALTLVKTRRLQEQTGKI
jgi:hypothetical protein